MGGNLTESEETHVEPQDADRISLVRPGKRMEILNTLLITSRQFQGQSCETTELNPDNDYWCHAF